MWITPSLSLGGSERHLVALATRAAQRGHEAHIVALRDATGSLAGSAPWAVGLGLSGVTDPRTMPRLVRWMRRLRPQLVHAYLSGFDAIAALPARLAQVPVVVGSRRELAWWTRPRHRPIQALGGSWVDWVVCCSEAARRDALAREAIPDGRYLVVRGGVDLESFRRRPEGRAAARRALGLGTAPTVLTVANFGVEKDHPTLLAAVRGILVARPDAIFLWAGDGPCRAAVEKAAADLVAGGRVRFLGRRDDVPTLLAAADVFALSSFSEGLPNVLLEAMAAEVPVVATAVGGVPEVITSGVEGLLVEARAPDALMRAVVEVLATPPLAAGLAAAGLRRVRRDHQQLACMDRQIELYQELVASG